MPYIAPSPGDVHVNRPLTNISIAYMQSAEGFVADRVFPNIPVTKQSDAYFTYARGDWNRDEMQDRAPGTESAGSSYEIGNDLYYARVRAVHKDIPDQVLDNMDSPLNADREATEFVTQKALIRREVTWASGYFKTGVWVFNVDGVAANPTAAGSFNPEDAGNNDKLKWTDAASTPIEDVRQGLTKVHERTGFRPNVGILGRKVYDALCDHPDIIARIDRGQTTGAAMANRRALAELFEIDEVLVMDGIVNNGKKGAAEASAFIGGSNALFCYRARTPGLLTVSAGYTFSWTGRAGNSQQGFRVKRIRNELTESTRVEAQQAYDQKVIGSDLGYFFSAII